MFGAKWSWEMGIGKLTKFLFCVIISGAVLTFWQLLISLDNNEPFKFDVLILSVAFGLGWAVYQVLFVLRKIIKEEGGISIWNWIKITVQGTIITLVLFEVLWKITR